MPEAPPIWQLAGAAKAAPALVDPSGVRSWEELEARTNQLGHGLASLGLPVGSHIVLSITNRSEFIEALLGCLRAGMVVTPVKTGWREDELGYVLDDAGTRLVITDVETARVTAAGRGVMLLDVDTGLGDGFETWLAGQDEAPLPRDRAGMRMSYTSGTTGRPKGVLRTQDVAKPFCEAFATSSMFARILQVPSYGPHLNASALFHGAPLAFSLSLLACGAPMHILGRWDAEAALVALAEGIHSTCLVPTMFRQILALPEELRAGFRAPDLNCVMHGGEPCPQPLKRRMIEWWGEIFTEYYGMTEGGMTVATSAEWQARPGTVGRATRGMTLEVRGEAGELLGPDEEGVIYFRNPAGRTFEYKGEPEKTAAAYADEGAFTVGDIGFLDAEGYLFISGRKADLIVSSGVNIYPAEIEDVLFALPEVADACVTSEPEEMRGEAVLAVLVLSAAAQKDEAAALARIEAACKTQLAGYKQPRRFLVRDEVPRDGTGKLLRQQLRAEIWGDRSPFAR
ncbi:MAG: AMP-binding protein [Deltaproteobacteria bacterium]